MPYINGAKGVPMPALIPWLGVFGCPSPTCGTPTGEASSRPAPLTKPRVFEMLHFEFPGPAAPPN